MPDVKPSIGGNEWRHHLFALLTFRTAKIVVPTSWITYFQYSPSPEFVPIHRSRHGVRDMRLNNLRERSDHKHTGFE